MVSQLSKGECLYAIRDIEVTAYSLEENPVRDRRDNEYTNRVEYGSA